MNRVYTNFCDWGRRIKLIFVFTSDTVSDFDLVLQADIENYNQSGSTPLHPPTTGSKTFNSPLSPDFAITITPGSRI
jgi:hypothetical protein